MRFVSESDIAARLQRVPGTDPRVVVSGNFATPWPLVQQLDASLARYRAFVLNPQAGWPVRQGATTETPFVGPGVRHDEFLDYIPMRLSLVPRLFSLIRPPDAVLLHTSTPRNGKVSLGIEVNILPAAIDAVRARGGLVIAQVNARMPYTLGDGEIDCDAIELALEADMELPSPVPCAPDDATAAIGAHVARFATDGCTLQLGIGQVPDAATLHLHRHRGLGVWSEMISDGVMGLARAGALDPRRPMQASFLFGTPELYRWADENPTLHMTRTEVINDPARIATNPAMLSLNAALQVDLFAQANASYVGDRPVSGFGGQPDFVVGALHSPGGHAVIALRSWHQKTDTSTVMPILESPVTSIQHSAMVTEQGSAEIFGHGHATQAELIITRCAHPRARDQLWKAAEALGLGLGRTPGRPEPPPR